MVCLRLLVAILMTRRREDNCICGKSVTAHFDAQGRFTRCPAIRKRDVPPTATVLVEALRRIYAQQHLRRLS